MTTNSKQTLLTIIISSISSVIVSSLVVGSVIVAVAIKPQTLANWLYRYGDQTNSSAINPPVDISSLSSDQEKLVVNTVDKVNPAVVSIIISRDVPIIEPYLGPNSNTSPFNDFFGFDPFTVPQYRQNGTQKQEIGGGSGFIVSTDGYIVTNKHVVEYDDAEYTVFTKDEKQQYSAKVVARDPSNDIAVLKIDAMDLPYLTFGDSDALQVGQTVIAIGNPLLQFNNSVSVGVISGLSRSIQAGDYSGRAEQLDNIIQTDAAINHGNSGGPLLNLKGEVIGMNTAVAESSSAQNLGFALPANLISTVVEAVKTSGTIIRPYLGVRYLQITPEVQKQNELTVDYGVLVVRGQQASELAVIPGSPADKAGIVENDVILEVDGKKLDENTSLSQHVGQKGAGDNITLKILHKGEEKTVEVTLEQRTTDASTNTNSGETDTSGQ